MTIDMNATHTHPHNMYSRNSLYTSSTPSHSLLSLPSTCGMIYVTCVCIYIYVLSISNSQFIYKYKKTDIYIYIPYVTQCLRNKPKISSSSSSSFKFKNKGYMCARERREIRQRERERGPHCWRFLGKRRDRHCWSVMHIAATAQHRPAPARLLFCRSTVPAINQ